MISRRSTPQGTAAFLILRPGGEEHGTFHTAKTVAGCFKYRNTIGPDVAVEALRDYLRLPKGAIDELIEYARNCRVECVMSQYMEALI